MFKNKIHFKVVYLSFRGQSDRIVKDPDIIVHFVFLGMFLLSPLHNYDFVAKINIRWFYSSFILKLKILFVDMFGTD